MEWIRKRATATLLSAATAVVMLQLVVPAIFDFIFDLILIGLVGLAAFINGDKKK
jgi:hypothetical protein